MDQHLIHQELFPHILDQMDSLTRSFGVGSHHKPPVFSHHKPIGASASGSRLRCAEPHAPCAEVAVGNPVIFADISLQTPYTSTVYTISIFNELVMAHEDDDTMFVHVPIFKFHIFWLPVVQAAMVVEDLHCFGPTSLSGVRRRFWRAFQGVMSGWVKDFAAGFDQKFDASPCYGVPVHCWRQVGRHFTT